MRPPSPARLLGLVVLVGVCGAGLLTQLQEHFILYRTPFAEPLPWGPEGEPLSQRVVICLVDGLRVDVSRTLDPVNELRRRGADWTLSVPEPTNSIPLSHVIITGAPQTTIGLLHNRAPIGEGFYEIFGNIYTAASLAGLRTGNVVTWRPGYPLENFLDAPNTLRGAPGDADDDTLVPRVRDVLAKPDPPHLLWVHFDIVDRAGHEAGAASAEYHDAARRTAARITDIASLMDWERETLIVTADHGHLDAGGHGGGEPEVATVPCVLVGAGIQAGAVGTAAQIDLASTVAWLLGTPIPTHSQGWPIYDALETSPEFRARRGYHTIQQRLRAYEFRLTQFGVEDKKLDAPMPHGLRADLVEEALANELWPVAWLEAANLSTELQIRWNFWLNRTRDRHLQPRILAAVGLALCAFLVSVGLRRRASAQGATPASNPPAWLLVGIVVGVALPVAVYLAPGRGYSLSWVGRHGLAAFAWPRVIEGTAGILVGWLVARWLSHRDPARPRTPGSILAGVAGGIAAVCVIGASVYLIGRGLSPRPWHESFRPLAVLLVSIFQMMGVAIVCLVAVSIIIWRDRDKSDAVD